MAYMFPERSSYVSMGNNPINLIDPKGNKEYKDEEAFEKENDGKKWSDKGEGDWLEKDREGNSDTWKDANKHNLQNLKPQEYTNIEQRTEFYEWFQGYSKSKGFDTKWAGAASQVAGGVDIMEDLLGFFNPEIKIFANEGNEMIFNDALPKLKALIEGPILKGKDAQDWDAITLAQEQWLITPLYMNLSNDAFNIIEVSSKSFAFIGGLELFPKPNSLLNPNHRWHYGMKGMNYNVDLKVFPKNDKFKPYIIPIKYNLMRN